MCDNTICILYKGTEQIGEYINEIAAQEAAHRNKLLLYNHYPLFD
jgi:hypothetical protein